MSILTVAAKWLRFPDLDKIAQDAATAKQAMAERWRPIREAQARIDTKVTQAQAHLGAARNALAAHDASLQKIERAVEDAQRQTSAHPVGSAYESQYSADGLWQDPRLSTGTKGHLSKLGVNAYKMFQRLPSGVAARNLDDAKKALDAARDTAYPSGVDLDTSKIWSSRDEHRMLTDNLRDLDHRARFTFGDIFGRHAVTEETLEDGTVIHSNPRLGRYPY